MNKNITFTRIFPEYHIRKGDLTYFAEQILNNLSGQNIKCDVIALAAKLNFSLLENFEESCGSKGHTIRPGNDWKVGDRFSPLLWQEKPRHSELIPFTPELEVQRTWTFNCNPDGVIHVNGSIIDDKLKQLIAANDGLSWLDFKEWILTPCYKNQTSFSGQIICWDDSIVY